MNDWQNTQLETPSPDRRATVRARLSRAALHRASEELRPYADEPGVASVLQAISASLAAPDSVRDSACGQAKAIPLPRRTPDAL